MQWMEDKIEVTFALKSVTHHVLGLLILKSIWHANECPLIPPLCFNMLPMHQVTAEKAHEQKQLSRQQKDALMVDISRSCGQLVDSIYKIAEDHDMCTMHLVIQSYANLIF